MTLPRLRVLVGVEPPESLRRLLVAAARRVAFESPTPLRRRPVPAVWYRDVIEPDPAVPYAVWAANPDDLDLAPVAGAAAVLTDDHDVADASGQRAVFVAEQDVIGDARLMLPVSRRRLRQARGLPGTLILQAADDGWSWSAAEGDDVPVPPDLYATALGVASAVVATGEHLLHAFAWGAPTVTDAATVLRVHARPGVDTILVEDPAGRPDRARDLAANEAEAAQVALAGRRLVEMRHDLASSVDRLLRRLRLRSSRQQPRHAMRDLLAELHTPADSAVGRRLEQLVEALPSRGDPS